MLPGRSKAVTTVGSSQGPSCARARHTRLKPSPPTGIQVAPVVAQTGSANNSSGDVVSTRVAPRTWSSRPRVRVP
eukprot:1330770-Lingulodinium_polyedra.AAC.1